MVSNIGYHSQSIEEVRHIELADLQTFPGSDGDVIRIYMVRHGESDLNISHDGIKKVQGQSPHVPLSEKGVRQADTLAQQMAPKMIDLKSRVVTSTAKRAIDTAKPLRNLLQQERLANIDEPLADSPEQVPSTDIDTDECLLQEPLAYKEFLELGSGKWEGVSKDDPNYLADYKKYKLLSANQKFSAPKVSTGESHSQVAARALDGLSKVLSQIQDDETVFIFGHSMLMNAVVLSLTETALSNDPGSPLPDSNIDNGDMILIEIPRGASVEQGDIKAVIHSRLQDA